MVRTHCRGRLRRGDSGDFVNLSRLFRHDARRSAQGRKRLQQERISRIGGARTGAFSGFRSLSVLNTLPGFRSYVEINWPKADACPTLTGY
jgi:hypothetical protein